MSWVRVPRRSWHVESGVTSRGGLVRTLCGRWVEPIETAPTFPPDEKTCETCLRLNEGRG